MVAGSSNAINLTDGIDGLAIGCTITVALTYLILSYVAGHKGIAEYLLASYVPGAGDLAVICAALVGALCTAAAAERSIKRSDTSKAGVERNSGPLNSGERKFGSGDGVPAPSPRLP